MRIPKGWVPVLAGKIIEELLKKEQIGLNVSREQAEAILAELILYDLMAEDRINQEVREMLKQFDSEIEKGRLDYRRLFDLTKKKLVKERNVVL